jgi:hypothetical protein
MPASGAMTQQQTRRLPGGFLSSPIVAAIDQVQT